MSTIEQTIRIRATPKQVYDALMLTKKHSQFTGETAKIANKVGGRFSCYDGYISGVNVELVPGKFIVQAWRSLGWPKGYYSIVSFRLSKEGRNQTKLEFTHRGIPTNDVKAKTAGWTEHYWTPLKAMLERSK